MDGNSILYNINKSEFTGFIYFESNVNIRQAEIVRNLLKNITVYD